MNSKYTDSNVAVICGEIQSECRFSHRTYGENFYLFDVGIDRNSGYTDKVIIMTSERILKDIYITAGEKIYVYGQVRTYNEDVNGRNRLNIVIFAKELFQDEPCEHQNEIYLEGFICKNPVQRTSPLGRKICDIMLAVNRMYNKSDYIPCIAWGRNAIYASTLSVGDKISVNGRLQSRQYRKKGEDGELVLRIAYEVSILQLETFPGNVV